jgi:hypothetical protein
MTFPLIAFFLWLVSVSPLPSGNLGTAFISVAGIQDQPTQTLLTTVGSMLPTDGSLQNAHDAFAVWRWYFSQDGIAFYPKSCTVAPGEFALIAQLPMQFQQKAQSSNPQIVKLGDRNPLGRHAQPGKLQASTIGYTPSAGIALFLSVVSKPAGSGLTYVTQLLTQVCTDYSCPTACTSDENYATLQNAVADSAFVANLNAAQTFYQQYLQILMAQGVNTASYPDGWVCAIKKIPTPTPSSAAPRTSKLQ